MTGCPEIADKLMPVGQAVSRFIPDGCQLAIGGFSITRNPMALAYEIVRQRVSGTSMLSATRMDRRLTFL